MKIKIIYYGLVLIMATIASSCSSKKDASDVKVKDVKKGFLYEVASFPQCHASTIIETKDGMLVSFFGGEYESSPDVSIYTVRSSEEGWEEPVKVADGFINDTLSYPTWNPVLFQAGDSLFLFYKVGPNPRDWWGEYMYSMDEGNTWSDSKRLPDSVLGPIKNKPIQLESGVVLSPSSIEYQDDIWKSHIELSMDNCKTWRVINIPSNDSVKVIQPTLLDHQNGKVQALLRSNQNVIMQSWSNDYGLSWSDLTPTDIPHPNSGIDAVKTESGLYLLVNNPERSGDSWDVGRNKLSLYCSVDGLKWHEILSLEDSSEGEFSYPAIIQGKDKRIHITYTYNRVKVKHVSLLLDE